MALLAGEDNIREVIAYPKTQSGADLMSGAPKPLTAKVLRELGHSGNRLASGDRVLCQRRGGVISIVGGDRRGRVAGHVGPERSVTPSPPSRAGSNRPPDLFDVAAEDELKLREHHWRPACVLHGWMRSSANAISWVPARRSAPWSKMTD